MTGKRTQKRTQKRPQNMSDPTTAGRMPVLFLSHGAPPLADDPIWPGQLAAWSAELPRPRAICMISAHWEDAPLALGATETVPLVYDFWGFDPKYEQVTYPAPGAPEVAASIRALLRGHREVADVPTRGLDHGAYVPLVEMYPDADVPVLQISLPTLDPAELIDLGRQLAPLRDAGVLVIGSGFFTHNLSALRERDVPTWSREFDAWGAAALDAGDLDALVDFRDRAPAGHLAHPRIEHFSPLFVTLGMADAAGDLSAPRHTIDSFWGGLSKRSVQYG